ncbi:short-chain dehydrogenase-like protein [Bisporella sp. PMI_857]|nr:short-chain dehydrogenase-like protein [Bisporella sp. PMI_857]
MAFASWLTQWKPPAPTFTEEHISKQDGKVFIITGGNQGVGLELIKILYPTGAKIYMASRSKDRAEEAIKTVITSDPSGASRLKFLHLDLDDLDIVRSAAKTFSEQETRLDVLWNNAGIGAVPVGSKTKQGIEAHIGVNAIAPLLFTQLLYPQLRAAASSAPTTSARVVWTGSWLMESKAPLGGYVLTDLENGGTNDARVNYATSKAANWMIADEVGRRWGKDGIVSVVQNPGNLNTHIYHTQSQLMMFFVRRLLYPPKLGAYTELFAGLSPEISEKTQGAYVIPWGRIQQRNPREDIYEALEKGKGSELWEWCDRQIKAHV